MHSNELEGPSSLPPNTLIQQTTKAGLSPIPYKVFVKLSNSEPIPYTPILFYIPNILWSL
jgi:hypothetical protein